MNELTYERWEWIELIRELLEDATLESVRLARKVGWCIEEASQYCDFNPYAYLTVCLRDEQVDRLFAHALCLGLE